MHLFLDIFFEIFDYARHSPSELGLCARLHENSLRFSAYPLRSLRRIFFAIRKKIFPKPVIVFTICAEKVCYKVSNTCYKVCNKNYLI